MNKSNILYIALFAMMTSVMMTSCSKENSDVEMFEQEEVIPTIDTINPNHTDTLVMYNPDFNDFFGLDTNLGGKAYLFKKDNNCDTGSSNYEYNYQIVTNDWDSFGGTPSIFDSTDGIPGFSFGINSDTQQFDEVTMWRNQVGSQNLFQLDSSSDAYSFDDDYEIYLTNVGKQLGQNIGGHVSGSVTNLTTTESSPFSAYFNVRITYICE